MYEINLPKVQNLVVYRGDTLPITLTFVDSAGVAIDITTYTVYFFIKRSEEDADASAVLSKTLTVHTDPTNGISAFSFTATEMSALRGAYFYDVQIKNGSGQVFTLVKGTLTADADIARAV